MESSPDERRFAIFDAQDGPDFLCVYLLKRNHMHDHASVLSMSTCPHTLPPGRARICSLCGTVVPKPARLAARLRGRHSATIDDINHRTVVANHGVTELRIVRGDDVRSVEVVTRPRSSKAESESPFVAEVLKGCRFSDGTEIKKGCVFAVDASVSVDKPRVVGPGDVANSGGVLDDNGNYKLEVSKK